MGFAFEIDFLNKFNDLFQSTSMYVYVCVKKILFLLL